MRAKPFCILLLLALMPPCPGAAFAQKGGPAGRPADGPALRRAFAALVQAFNDRDARAAMALFAEDVVLSYPGRPDADYKTIRESFEKRFASPPPFPVRVETEIEEIQTSGDMGFIRVFWVVRDLRPNADPQIISREKDLEIWRRQKDGRWRLARGLSFHLQAQKPS